MKLFRNLVFALALFTGAVLSVEGQGIRRNPTVLYQLPILATLHNPADATTYYFGGLPSTPVTAQGFAGHEFQHRGRIIGIVLNTLVAGTAAVGDADVAVSLRLNETTNYAVTTTFRHVTGQVTASVNIPIVSGDEVEVILGPTPTWSTNPTSVIYSGSLLVESYGR